MDMQPLTATSSSSSLVGEPPSGGHRTKRRSIAYAKPFAPRKPSLATTANGTLDVDDGDGSKHNRSPSKFPLLGGTSSSQDDSSYKSSNTSSKGMKRHGKKTAKSGGSHSSSQNSSGTPRPSAGFKISRALFRDYRDPHGNFSKMDFVASDATGNHKKQRPSKQRYGGPTSNNSHNNAYNMDSLAVSSSAIEEQMSFDATSNTSEVDDEQPFTSTNEKKQQQKQKQRNNTSGKPLGGILLSKKKKNHPQCVLLEAGRDTTNEATISMESDASFQLGVPGPPSPKDNNKDKAPNNNISNTTKDEKAVVPTIASNRSNTSSSTTGKASSYVSQSSNPTPTEETADPLTDCNNIPSDIQEKLLAQFELSACAPSNATTTSSSPTTTTTPCNEQHPTRVAQTSSAFVKPSSMGLLANNDTNHAPVGEGINGASQQSSSRASASTSSKPDATTSPGEPPKLTSAKNVAAKKIQPLKPPPSLPPKAPRKQYGSSSISASSSSAAVTTTEQKQKQHQQHKQTQALRQRLLLKGDFLNESSRSSKHCDNKENNSNNNNNKNHKSKENNTMAMKILERLECTNFEQLMSEHYDQDPPITVNTNDKSSGTNESSSSSSAAAANANNNNNTSPPARRQNGSSNAAMATADAGGRGNAIAANSNGNGTNNSYNNNSYAAFMLDSDKSGSTESGGGVEECKINYLYSQEDNHEYENSILSPSICSQVANWPKNNRSSNTAAARSRPTTNEEKDKRQYSPVSPSRYRSDAINAFIQKAQSPKRCSVARELFHDRYAEEHGNHKNNRSGDDGVDDDDDDDHVAEEGPKIVSDEFLNLVTSGCTGGVASQEAKESLKEKIVALEAGWTGLRSQFSDRVNDLEETWKNWNLDSLLKFASPDKETPPPSSATSATLQTTPSAEIPSNVWQMSREDTVTPIHMFAESEQVECTFNGRRAQPMTKQHDQVVRGVINEFAHRDKNKGTTVERISIGSTEQDVPMSLKDTLADISGIQEGGDGPLNLSAVKEKPLDSSREDSEGGKVILDAAEWDPVEASDAEEVHVDLSGTVSAAKGKYYKHSTSGKVLRSPTSVLAEI